MLTENSVRSQKNAPDFSGSIRKGYFGYSNSAMKSGLKKFSPRDL